MKPILEAVVNISTADITILNDCISMLNRHPQVALLDVHRGVSVNRSVLTICGTPTKTIAPKCGGCGSPWFPSVEQPHHGKAGHSSAQAHGSPHSTKQALSHWRFHLYKEQNTGKSSMIKTHLLRSCKSTIYRSRAMIPRKTSMSVSNSPSNKVRGSIQIP